MVRTFPSAVSVAVPFSDRCLQTNIAGPVSKSVHVHYAAPYFTWEQETCKLHTSKELSVASQLSPVDWWKYNRVFKWMHFCKLKTLQWCSALTSFPHLCLPKHEHLGELISCDSATQISTVVQPAFLSPISPKWPSVPLSRGCVRWVVRMWRETKHGYSLIPSGGNGMSGRPSEKDKVEQV